MLNTAQTKENVLKAEKLLESVSSIALQAKICKSVLKAEKL